MIRAATAHGKHEARIGKADPNWPDHEGGIRIIRPNTIERIIAVTGQSLPTLNVCSRGPNSWTLYPVREN